MSETSQLCLNHPMVWLRRLIVASAVVLVLMLASLDAQAQGPHRAGLVVVYRNGQVSTHCVEFSEPSISGYEVLMRAGLDVGIDASNSMGVAICRIGSDGCNYPQQPCFCQCTDLSGAVPCEYWSYWHLQGSTWQYSGMGASNHQVAHGDVEGWVWGSGMMNGASPPPSVTFDQLCSTPGQPADVPQQSSPPKFADDGERLELPVITRFVADRTLIQAGDSVVLDWELHDAKKAYLIYDDVQQGIEGEGPNSQAVLSPTRTTTYTLLARNDDGDVSQQVVVVVNPVTPTPSETPTPSPTPTSVPTATPTSTSTPTFTPVAPPTLTPTATQLPSATPLTVSGPSAVPALFTSTPAPGLPGAQGVSTRQPAKASGTMIARRTAAPARLAEVSGDVATVERPSAREASPRRQSGLLVVWLGLGLALALGGLVTIGIVVTVLLIVRSGKAGRR